MMKARHAAGAALLILLSRIELASAVEFEPMNKALLAVLGTPKVQKKSISGGGSDAILFWSKGPGGKPEKAAFVEKGLYEPDCTHTWVVGIDPKTGKVSQIRVVEMKCQHAFPCRQGSFLDFYKGKGPADLPRLVKGANVIAKATGTADLTTAAVRRSIENWQKVKGSL
jgi:hypothetical protein